MELNETEKELWERITEDLRTRCGVGQYSIDTQLCKLTLTADTGTKLIFSYPADFLIDWVEINYADKMAHAAAHVLHGAREICFVCEDMAAAPHPEEQQTPAATTPRKTTARPRRRRMLNSGLNTDYTFDNFVVGPANNFAFAAAQAVAACSASSPHLLFIHGESGLGKTHLLQAIGNEISAREDGTQVLYLTSETFLNDYIEAVSKKGDAISLFRRKYRKADVLLIDDVQYLTRGSKTQEEFFHTFNALFASGKQIVLSSDCPASEIVNLESRLLSRFQQGLTVELLAPDYETRRAILLRRIKDGKNTLISTDLLDYLARNITHSVRELEGALVRLTTFAAFCNRPLTIAEARLQLHDMLRQTCSKQISIEEIQQRVAEEFQVRVADINGRRRTAAIARCRQVAMYLARKHTDRSLQDIGAAFGGRDHGTVLHAERTIADKMADDAELRECVNRLAATLR